MDGRGGCCIARYAGGAYEKSKVDRIMLRFRPIAPKPAVAGAVSGSSSPENNNNNNNNNDIVFKAGRTKRRYVMRDRDTTNKRCNRKRKLFSEQKKEDDFDDATKVVTLLPLLPEMPDQKGSPAPAPFDLDLKAASLVQNGPIWLSLNPGVVVMPEPVRPVRSLVTVERVTEGYEDGEGLFLGYTDEERRKNLERDTCPGFISDGVNRVEWTNEAYRKMIGEREGRRDEIQKMVWLVTKERLPMSYRAFACRVRLQYTCRKEKHSLTVPCDVWRMDGGGFAWRLDVTAALCLGR